MIYLHRYTPESVEMAACEDADRAAPYEARGFERCTPDAFRIAWRIRDAMDLQRMQAMLAVDLAREVGDPAPMGGSNAGPSVALEIGKLLRRH